MTPVKQTKTGPEGNCFQACIASIFDCDIDDVPDLESYKEGGGVDKLNDWLKPKGLAYIEVTVLTSQLVPFFMGKNILHVIVAKTERSESIGGLSHAVVGLDGVVVFDPHPTNAGIVYEEATTIGLFLVSAETMADINNSKTKNNSDCKLNYCEKTT